MILCAHRYMSRCILLNFHGKPAQNFCVLGFAQLHQLMLEAYGAIGDVIAMGHRFFAEGMAELDKVIPCHSCTVNFWQQFLHGSFQLMEH